MAKFLSPASMGLVGEGLQCWNKLEDRLSDKVSQLTKLLHHYSAYPPEAETSDADPEEIAGQHESEIHEILNDAASRIRQFKASLHIEAQENRTQEAVEALRDEHEVLQRATQSELRNAQLVAKQLEQEMKQGKQNLQETMKAQAESFAREKTLLKNELQTKAEELEKAKLTSKQYLQETEELKKCHQTEMEEERGKLAKKHQHLVMVTQQQLQSQAREIELQEHVKNQSEVHSRALKEMEALQKAEIERLKLESFIELEKLSQDCAAQEADWYNEKLEFQKQIELAAQEKVQVTSSLSSVEEALAKEKESTSELQTVLDLAEDKIQMMREKLETVSASNDNLSIALGIMKQEALDSRIAHDSAMKKWEAVAVDLKQDLANVTNTCTAYENDIHEYQVKADELAFQLVTSRRELTLAKIESERLQTEMQKLSCEIARKEQEIQNIQDEAEARNQASAEKISCLQLECIAQNENSVQKMKETMEMKIHQQLQTHESDVQILQKTFMSQLEEEKKEYKLQLQALNEKLKLQREENARAKSANAEFSKAIKAVETTLEKQESHLSLQIVTYEEKVAVMMRKLESFESSGSNLEEEFGYLSKQMLRHSTRSKQVESIQQKTLKEMEEKCLSLEMALVTRTREYTASTAQHAVMVENLKQTMVEQERAHNDAISSASESYSSQIKQCMDDIQKLKDKHTIATSSLQQAHEDAEVVGERAKLENRLQRNQLELNREIELMKLEFEKTLYEHEGALHETQQKHDRLLRTHLAAMKDQKKASETELERCQQVNADALISCNENFTQRMDNLEVDHMKQLDKLEQSHLKELEDVTTTYDSRLSANEENWKKKLAFVEKDWRSRFENEEVLWRIEKDSDTEELRKSLLFSFTEEKNLMVADHKARVCKLDKRISQLEISISQKDEKILQLLEDITRMDESNRKLVLDLKEKHKADLFDILEKQRVALDEVKINGELLVQELKEKHKMERESSHADMEKMKVQMTEKQADLQKKLQKLQERFFNRESRVEDVARISKLQLTCEQKDSTITKLSGRATQLQLELCNREVTYNKIFGNAAIPILQQGISDWLKPKHKNENSKVDTIKLTTNSTKVDKNSKVDIGVCEKRANSATRLIVKPLDNNTPSTSTFH